MRLILYIFLVYLSTFAYSEEGNNESKENGEAIACIHGDQCVADTKSAGKDSAEATNIAQKAAQEAKAAESAQQQAGLQAAHQVKEQLADKAIVAAKAAKAALAGKEIIVDELNEEMRQADTVESQETEHVQALQNVMQASSKSVQDSKAEAKILNQLLHIVDSNIQEAEKVESGIQVEVNEKQQLIEQAKKRKEELVGEMGKAQQDLQKTKSAASNAEAAAVEAKQNVQKSGSNKRSVVIRRRK